MADRWGSGRGFPRKTRDRILRRDGWVCVECGEHEDVEVDHVVSRAEAERLGWSRSRIDHESNGQTLCVPHHRAKTLREAADGRRRAAASRDARGRRPQERHPGLIR